MGKPHWKDLLSCETWDFTKEQAERLPDNEDLAEMSTQEIIEYLCLVKDFEEAQDDYQVQNTISISIHAALLELKYRIVPLSLPREGNGNWADITNMIK
ncbi:hypothetical protein [Laceyella putida]|uniref:Uncharacterized protein n=1 Tax=Laceyella putida TaxID=110101 RepID=A0ABW2RR21_9BACL